MTTLVGRGVRIEVEKTAGTTKNITAITNANPGVATSTAHGFTDGTVGFLTSVEGMVQMEDMAVRIDAPTTNDFQLQGLNTTGMPAFSGSTVFTPITAWDTLSTATGYQLGGGEADSLDATTLLDDIKQEISGYLAAQSATINVNSETANSAAMQTVFDAAMANRNLTFRITLKDGSLRVFRGTPSLPGEDVQKGAIGTGSFSVKVRGFVLALAA